MAHLDNPDAFRQFDLNHAACLTKRGKTIHHVVLRVFIIADGYVFYFKNAAATQPSGLLPIDGSEYKLHKYQVSPHLYNSCFELRTPLRSWGSVVLHYHGCSESDVQDIVHQLETAGSKRVRDTFTEPSAACPATTEEEEEKLESPTSAPKEACPSTPSSDRITTQSTFTSIMSSDVALAESPLCQIHHIDKRGLKVPLLDLTWTELHEEYPDMCKALGLPLDDSHGSDKTLDISTDLCHDLCTNGTIVRPWGTLSMETATSHGFRSSLSSSMSFASENDVGSSTVHLETSSIVTAPAAVSPLASPSPEETSPQEDSTSRRRISRRSSVHRKVGISRETSLVISSGIVLPPKAIPDVKLIQAISLAESYSGGFSLRQYTPLKIIGKGGFGQVMVARHNLTHQIFAIKTMNKHTLTTQNQVAHTKAERNVLIKCYNHPFIVKLHAAFQTIDHLHMVLEFCPGGELFFHLSKASRFSESQTAFYAAEVNQPLSIRLKVIFLALDHLHAHAIIYRDLKPENVLLDRDGHVRLADFGLSKENVSERKLAATFCGSAEYISPEVLELADATCDDSAPVLGGYDKGVDLWALGCLIFELLTGLPPFYSGKCRTELYAKIKEGYVDFPPYLSADAKDVVSRLLNPNPRERLGYKDPNELKSHAFFMDKVTDWDKLMAREVMPPMQPPTGEYMNFDDAFTSIPLDKQVLEDMAEFTKRNTMEHQLFDNYNWAPEGGTVPNAS
ncbi:unnamed protein product [Aphanomyces euteiches]